MLISDLNAFTEIFRRTRSSSQVKLVDYALAKRKVPSDIGLKSKIPDRVSKREGMGKRSSSDAHDSLNIVTDNGQKVKHDP
jgi:hypothetical protein